MIDLRDCDVEELTRDDFIDGESSYTTHFTISMMKLAKIGTAQFPASGVLSPSS